jgi:hypothetical protein
MVVVALPPASGPISKLLAHELALADVRQALPLARAIRGCAELTRERCAGSLREARRSSRQSWPSVSSPRPALSDWIPGPRQPTSNRRAITQKCVYRVDPGAP